MIAPFREQTTIKHKLIKMEICDENPNTTFSEDIDSGALKPFRNGSSSDNGLDNHRSFPVSFPGSPLFKSAPFPIKLENGHSSKIGVNTAVGLTEPTGKPFLKHAPFDKVVGAEVRMCAATNEENQVGNSADGNRWNGEKSSGRMTANKVTKAPRRRKKN